MVAVAEGGDGDGSDLLQRYPVPGRRRGAAGVSGTLRLTLERAVEKMNSSAAMRQLQGCTSAAARSSDVLNKIGVQLSAERDIDKLLDLILQKSREITGADAGSLYLVEHAPDAVERRDGLVEKPADQLRFKLAQNDTMALPFEERAMPLDKKSIAGYVAVTGEKQNVTDAYQLSERLAVPHQSLLRRECRATAPSRCWSSRCATTGTG